MNSLYFHDRLLNHQEDTTGVQFLSLNTVTNFSTIFVPGLSVQYNTVQLCSLSLHQDCARATFLYSMTSVCTCLPLLWCSLAVYVTLAVVHHD